MLNIFVVLHALIPNSIYFAEPRSLFFQVQTNEKVVSTFCCVLKSPRRISWTAGGAGENVAGHHGHDDVVLVFGGLESSWSG